MFLPKKKNKFRPGEFSVRGESQKEGFKNIKQIESPCVSTRWHLAINQQITLVTRRIPSTQNITEMAYITGSLIF